MHHELVPKTPTDAEAMNTVINIRDSVFSAAAAVEVVLSIHDPHDIQALRGTTCVSSIQWTDVQALRGTTCVQPPTRLRFELQQAQHAILGAITHNGPLSPTSDPAWKVLLLSWLPLGRTAENASDANCASFLELDWTSSGLRNGLHWPWCVLNATLLLLLKHAQGQRPNRPKQESARVATLARAGEKGRALALPGRHRSIQCPSLTHLHS